jgi:hypothetical protein
MNSRRLYFGISYVSLAVVLSAATPNALDCKQNLLQAYNNLTGGPTEKNRVFHLKFTTQILYRTPKRSQAQQATSQGEMYNQGAKGFFQTPEIMMWQDGQYIATVIPKRKTIFLTRAVPGQNLLGPKQVMAIRDTIISQANVKECTVEKIGGINYRHMQLALGAVAAKRTHTQSMDFWLTTQNKLDRMHIRYGPGAMMESTTMHFPVQEWLASSPKIPTSAFAQVVDSHRKPIAAYQGYHVEDQTTTKK